MKYKPRHPTKSKAKLADCFCSVIQELKASWVKTEGGFFQTTHTVAVFLLPRSARDDQLPAPALGAHVHVENCGGKFPPSSVPLLEKGTKYIKKSSHKEN